MKSTNSENSINGMDNCPEKVMLTEQLIAMKREQMKLSLSPEQLKLLLSPEQLKLLLSPDQLELQIKLNSSKSNGKTS
jgi:hypothetical protein